MSDEVLKSALAKTQRKEKLNRGEQQALDRARREQAERTLRDGVAAFPKKLYVELSGRQHKILDQQAGRYGLPLLGKQIDLGSVLRRFHDLLRDHGDQLAGQVGGESAVDWEEENKKVRALLLRAELAELCGQLLRKPLVEQFYQRLASLLRGLGERLQHEGHTEASQLLDETLNEGFPMIEELLGGQPSLQDELEASGP